MVSSHGNSTAQKFGYQGIEKEEALGLNLHEMDFRQYDASIGRFTGIDPVTHHSMSTYTAFDNNPVYWADPSGADAESLINDIWNNSGSGKTTWTNNGDGTFSGSNGATAVDDDHIVNSSEKELQTIADDLNSVYKGKYGESPFSVKKQTRKRKVKTKDGFWPFTNDEYKEEEYEVYVLVGSMGFNWEKDKYTKALYEIINSKEDIVLDIIPDKGNVYNRMKFSTGRGHLADFGGGSTDSRNRISLSNALYTYGSKGSGRWTVAGVALHELLFHISPNKSLDEGANVLRRYYNLKTGRDHNRGRFINQNIKN